MQFLHRDWWYPAGRLTGGILVAAAACSAAPGVALAEAGANARTSEASAPAWPHEARVPEYVPPGGAAELVRGERPFANTGSTSEAQHGLGFVSTTHTIEPGDTFAAIAAAYGLPLTTLLVNNPLVDPQRLLVGDHVVVPGGAGLLYTVAPGDTVRSIAAAYGVPARDIRSFTPNGLFRADLLTPGAEILIPGVSAPPDAATEPTPASIDETPNPRHTPGPTPEDTPATETPVPEPTTPEAPAIPPGPAHTTDGLNLRDGPGTSYAVLITMSPLQNLDITGDPIDGFFPIWTAGMAGWAAGEYLAEGYAPVTPAPAPADPAPVGTLGVDDYPYAGSTDIDPWGFEGSNCTSFVAWRMNSTFGIPLRADFAGGWWGDAGYWDSAATTAGYLVDDIPTVGSIAQWRGAETIAGYGHVAIVLAVYQDSSVLIEEYNAMVPYGYSQRVVYAPRFIHLGQ